MMYDVPVKTRLVTLWFWFGTALSLGTSWRGDLHLKLPRAFTN
jgi:hypothetical protein